MGPRTTLHIYLPEHIASMAKDQASEAWVPLTTYAREILTKEVERVAAERDSALAVMAVEADKRRQAEEEASKARRANGELTVADLLNQKE